MTRWLWILALLIIIIEIQILGIYCHAENMPYVVTVTDAGKLCVKSTLIQSVPYVIGDLSKCADYEKFICYHLPGFQDCVSSSTVQCDYLYDIAAGLNMAAEKREGRHE